jgi:hypothetical protein
MPMQVGKYITYRLDSLEFINFGTKDTIISYLARDVVDDTLTDNLGRPGFRVIRYLSDTTGSLPWTPNLTYWVTPTRQAIEVVENNMRYLKLVLPVVDGFSWQGNSYIDTRSASSQVTYLDGWNYTYDSLGSSFSVPFGLLPNTVTIQQANDSVGNPAIDSTISSRTFSEEVYAKDIGLIYKNEVYWLYQPPNLSIPVGSTTGFGIRLQMVDHN